jgi:hypothetical protein
MRALVVPLVLLGFAAPAAAQQRGAFAFDAMTTPGRHFGAGYYFTNALSLRPSLGFGWSQAYGTSFNLGTDLRYEFLTQNRVSPYLAGSYNFLRSPYLTQSVSGVVRSDPSTIARWGGGGGLRARLNDRFSVFADGPGTLLGATRVAETGAHFEGALGLTFFLN